MQNKNKRKIALLLIILAACGMIGVFLLNFNKAQAESDFISENAAAGEFIVKLNKNWNSNEENIGKIKKLFSHTLLFCLFIHQPYYCFWHKFFFNRPRILTEKLYGFFGN